MANWDEDAITMAVEAARDCLAGTDRKTLSALYVASTTHPFDDRQSAALASTALNLAAGLRALDVGGSLRYASDSYGDLDNSDTANGVFGAHDAYTQLGLRTSYRMTDGVRLSLGIDNLTDEIAFVHHPWPGRTMYLEAAFDL